MNRLLMILFLGLACDDIRPLPDSGNDNHENSIPDSHLQPAAAVRKPSTPYGRLPSDLLQSNRAGENDCSHWSPNTAF